jgi:hypothetical protein
MQTWTTIDKSGWHRGEWDDEPDKAQWVDPDTGLDCLIVRQRSGGHLCGYVGVPPSHPYYGVDYSECSLPTPCTPEDRWCHDHSPIYNVDVHGDLTYAAACQLSDDPATGICHIPEPGRPDDVWWLGFDCGHAWDASPAYIGDPLRDSIDSTYKWFGYVQGEVTRLAAQLAEVNQ